MHSFIRILAIVLVALGITFLIWGLNESDTFANRFLKEMAGTYPDETRNYIFGGVAMIAIGAAILLTSIFRRKK